MQFPWRSFVLGTLFTVTTLCLIGCGDPTDPSTMPASPAAEDQPITEGPPPTP